MSAEIPKGLSVETEKRLRDLSGTLSDIANSMDDRSERCDSCKCQQFKDRHQFEIARSLRSMAEKALKLSRRVRNVRRSRYERRAS